MGGGEAVFGELAGGGHEHGMAAAIDAHFDGIDIEFEKQFLEVGEDVGGE